MILVCFSLKVRGIPVDHWQSCLKFQGRNGSFTLDYFFSKPLYNMSYGSHPVPVRAVVNGTGLLNTEQNYRKNLKNLDTPEMYLSQLIRLWYLSHR